MDTRAAEMLCHIRERVEQRIGVNRYRTWFGESTEFTLRGGRLDVAVTNAFAGSWIAGNFMRELADVAREVFGVDTPVDVRVVAAGGKGGASVLPAATDSSQDQKAPARRAASAGRNGHGLRGDLDTFVVGPSNRLAHAAACRLVDAPTQAASPLVLHGGCGLGKTHLLQGICNGVRTRRPTLEWRYVSGEEFTNEFISAVKSGRIDLFRARFRSVDLLLIDDIHFLANKKATQAEFLHTFNAIYACGKAVVLSSDRHPRSISLLSEPLISRLVAGMVVEVEPPDFATRREILRRRVATMHCQIPDDVLDYLARGISRNVRELEGVLYKLVALAALTRETISVELARRAVEDYLPRTTNTPLLADIEAVVAQRFGLARELLHSRSRDRSVSAARSIAMYLARKQTGMSFPEIGRAMGGKNHATVLIAAQRIEQKLKDNGVIAWKTSSGPCEAPLAALLAELEQQIAQRRA